MNQSSKSRAGLTLHAVDRAPLRFARQLMLSLGAFVLLEFGY